MDPPSRVISATGAAQSRAHTPETQGARLSGLGTAAARQPRFAPEGGYKCGQTRLVVDMADESGNVIVDVYAERQFAETGWRHGGKRIERRVP